MPVDAPTITQTAPSDVVAPSGSEVATLLSATATSYAISSDPSGIFAVAADKLTLTAEGTGSHTVEVTATDGIETSLPGTGSLTFGEAVVEPPPETGDDILQGYENNPQLPPETAQDEVWKMFIVAATHALVPNARDGIDFVVSRPDKNSPLENIHWDDVKLGQRPDAEIEAEAKLMAAGWPTNVSPV